ncbi:prevent-host-death family protein [Roseivivax marinus]|uniref:Antitoxin n=1 Tax=Roseivivax marinus TaxID=1379903 RepID=W4HG99_9RHOB|nr:prevent-host-death family protein [Roseivivax marinus]
MKVNITEAKARLSELIAAAQRGEEVILARRGHPLARIVSTLPTKPKFRFGIAAGEVDCVPDFFEPMREDECSRWDSGGPST